MILIFSLIVIGLVLLTAWDGTEHRDF